MKIETEIVIDGGSEGVMWGMSATGNPVLVAFVGSKRVRIEMTPAQTKEACCGGIYAATAVQQARAPSQAPQSTIVDARGQPVLVRGQKGGH